MTQTLSQLENRDAFIERHIGPDAQQQQEMLKTVGADSLNALIGQIVPQENERRRAHVCTPVTFKTLLCRLLLENKKRHV
ncbi:hypothetical protein, partial [Klebsiella pneumoniae]|uniref:hypothetical protein n=1 Tax=Klebsiella pneumoniae TaxID=573 RepID=UPI001CEC51F3